MHGIVITSPISMTISNGHISILHNGQNFTMEQWQQRQRALPAPQNIHRRGNNLRLSESGVANLSVDGNSNTVSMSGCGNLIARGDANHVTVSGSGALTVFGNHNIIDASGCGNLKINGNHNRIAASGVGLVIVNGNSCNVSVGGLCRLRMTGNQNVYSRSGLATVQIVNPPPVNQDVQDIVMVDTGNDLSRAERLRQRFPTLCVAKVCREEAEKKRECRVCIDTFDEDQEVVTLPCFHRFHGKCMLDWNQDICPLCRHPVTITEHKGSRDNPIVLD